VAKVCQPLVDLKVLAASDSVEGFVLSYTSLLEQAPGITPALLERLITARADIARADVKEVRHRMPLSRHSGLCDGQHHATESADPACPGLSRQLRQRDRVRALPQHTAESEVKRSVSLQ